MTFSMTTTLGAIRQYLRTHADKGTTCPACEQEVKVYRRKVNSGMARSLIAMFTIAGTDWVHVPTQIGARSREEGKLAYWGLIQPSPEPREDGGKSGWWRVTPRGKAFVLMQLNIPTYCRVYNGKVLGFDGAMVSITDALGTKFNYNDLMAGR